MVGRLSLPDVPELPDSKRRSERGLDSPDSGLPPSPGSCWLLAAGGAGSGSEQPGGLANVGGLPVPEAEATPLLTPGSKPPSKDGLTSVTTPTPSCTSRLCPLSFGEGVEFDPLPPKDIRYTSSVKYDSEKHFISNIYMPVGLRFISCSQTVICVPDSTWRNYKAEVSFQPRHRAQSFTSTAIIYPKHTTTVYTTTLDYNCRKHMRRFLSSVELESSGNDTC